MSTLRDGARSSAATRRERRAERRRLLRTDVLTARLGELQAIQAVLRQATEVVTQGWVQNAWFVVTTPGGDARAVAAHEVGRAVDLPVVGACLVGGIVEAGGGPAAARSQLVSRSLDLTWHTLHEDPRQPVRWCPGPDVRTGHLQDLTRWNDAPDRTHGEVVGLLLAAQHTVDSQRDLCRDELAGLGLTSAACARSATARPEIPTSSA